MKTIGYVLLGWYLGIAFEAALVQHGSTPHSVVHTLVLAFVVWTALVWS